MCVRLLACVCLSLCVAVHLCMDGNTRERDKDLTILHRAPHGQEWVGRYENNQDAAHGEQNMKILKVRQVHSDCAHCAMLTNAHTQSFPHTFARFVFQWVQKLLKRSGLPQDKDIDYTDFVRLVLRRRYDHVKEAREAGK